jgi:serine/threonine protein kinase
MKIKCPECQAVLSLGDPKPGGYRPRCKQCGKTFVLKVSSDNPPKVAVGRDRESTPSTASNSQAKATSTSAATPATEATMDATMDSAVKPAGVGKSVAQQRTQNAQTPARTSAPVAGTMVDATMDATMDQGSAKQGDTIRDRRPVDAANRTQGANLDETMAPSTTADQTMDNSSASTAPSQRSATRVSTSKVTVKQSVSALKSSGPQASVNEDASMPQKLGGYRLLKTLGRGAMGAVYEAKQVSLDRLVALKTIRDRLVNHPSALARFTREAYAAAQLNHHNIVQIYDFGEDSGQHYFSMERVDGLALNEVIRDNGPLEARLAATYVLQAARGLQHAHDRGMVHRDIKPANLLLSHEGVVKVADLGLVKVPDQLDISDAKEPGTVSAGSGTQVTMMGTAVGTPAYMAPEQSTDATSVDHRADIYSLGCTLYYLLIGKPPFEASEVSALLAQHAQDPVPKVCPTHPHIPQIIDTILQRSMEKKASDRYQSLAEMIRDLESFLGIQSGASYSPSVADADAWATNAKAFFASAPMARLRPLMLLGLIGLSIVMLLATPWIGFKFLLMGPACLIVAIMLSLFLQASHGESPLLIAIRSWIGTLGLVDWVYAGAAAVLLIAVALFAGWWLGLLVGVILGAIAGAAYHYGLRMPIHSARQPSLEQAEKMIRTFRVSGADEEGLRAFVARYSGRSWSELFSAVFGYDALLKMQTTSSSEASIPKPPASFQQWLVNRIAKRVTENQQALDQAKLSKVEKKALLSEGVSAAEANERAWQMAAAVIDSAKIAPGLDQAAANAQLKRDRMKAMLAEARSGKYAKRRDPLAPVKLLIGAQLRLIAGIALLSLLAMWGHRSGLLSGEQLSSVTKSFSSGEVNLNDVGQTLRTSVQAATSGGDTAEVPRLLGAHLVSVALAGFFLTASAFVSGWRMTPFAFVGAAICLWGASFGIPDIGPVPGYLIAAAAGIGVMIPGAWFSERAE